MPFSVDFEGFACFSRRVVLPFSEADRCAFFVTFCLLSFSFNADDRVMRFEGWGGASCKMEVEAEVEAEMEAEGSGVAFCRFARLGASTLSGASIEANFLLWPGIALAVSQ